MPSVDDDEVVFRRWWLSKPLGSTDPLIMALVAAFLVASVALAAFAHSLANSIGFIYAEQLSQAVFLLTLLSTTGAFLWVRRARTAVVHEYRRRYSASFEGGVFTLSCKGEEIRTIPLVSIHKFEAGTRVTVVHTDGRR